MIPCLMMVAAAREPVVFLKMGTLRKIHFEFLMQNGNLKALARLAAARFSSARNRQSVEQRHVGAVA